SKREQLDQSSLSANGVDDVPTERGQATLPDLEPCQVNCLRQRMSLLIS
ncbi:MAG: hypothetical protein QOF62_2712, partial [Pyrinomonadaceae bacterium]|nr:hypothetical protein [Pyrinomonadaceae bacterium]